MTDHSIDIDGYDGMKIELMSHAKGMTSGQLIALMIDTFWTSFTESFREQEDKKKVVLEKMSPQHRALLTRFLKA